MRLVLLLIAVVVIGFLMDKQLNTTESNASPNSSISNSATPKPPRNSEDLLKLKKDLNQLMQDTADKRAKSIEDR